MWPDPSAPLNKVVELLTERSNRKARAARSNIELGLTVVFRVYCGVICVASLCLGLLAILSCVSAQTADFHILSVRTAPLVGLSIKTVWTETRTDIIATDISNVARDVVVKSLSSLPDEYKFGISGVCRIWDPPNAITECDANLFHESDVMELIREDFGNGAAVPGMSKYDTSLERFQWNTMTESASVLLIVATSCTFILTFLVQFDFLPFLALASLILLNALSALASASLWTATAVSQAGSYSVLMAPLSSDSKHPVAFGPGFYILWVFSVCSLILTPLMAKITGLILFQLLVLVVCLGLLLVVSIFLLLLSLPEMGS